MKAEEGELLISTKINDKNKILCLKGILNNANNMSVISTKTCSIKDGKGYFQFPNSITPHSCYNRDGFAYATFRLLGSGKSLSSICSQLGFTSNPLPSERNFIFACHLKFNCAGSDTLCDTLAILGYSINRNVTQSVLHECSRCITKTFFSGPVRAQNDLVSAKPSLSPTLPSPLLNNVFLAKRPASKLSDETEFKPIKRTKEINKEAENLEGLLFGAVDTIYDNDILVFDHAVLKSSYLLCGKLEKRGLYFVDYTTNKNELDTIVNALTSFKSVITAVHCDQAKEFNIVKSKCVEYGIDFNPSNVGRETSKGRQECVVKVVKQVYAQIVSWFH